MKTRRFTLPLILAAVAACDRISDPAYVCPAWARPAVDVSVYDARNRAPITGGSTLELRDGARLVTVLNVPSTADGAPPQASAGIGGAGGTYTLTVRRAGYQPWTRASIKVVEGKCSVETVHLDVDLQPES